MKLLPLVAPVLALVLPTLVHGQATVTCDSLYDNPNNLSSEVACSSYLQSHGWDTLGVNPSFPFIGAVPGQASDVCGACYRISVTGGTVYLLGVDTAGGFVISEQAYQALTGGTSCGAVSVNTVQMPAYFCGLFGL